jgi:hypothetical protein
MVSDQVGAGPHLVAPVNPEFTFPSGDVEAIAQLLLGAAADRSRCVAHMQSWSPEKNIAATVEAVRLAVARKHMRSSGDAHNVSAAHPGSPAPQKLHE